MPHLQAEVPDPLRNDLPALLPPGGVTTPAIRVLFDILIGQRRFKGAAKQIQLDDIGGRERVLRQGSEEEFVDDAAPREADSALLEALRMARHHHAAQHPFGSHRHVRTVVEAAYQVAFRALLELIWGQVQACLDQGVIQYRVLLATGHKSKARQISEHRSGAILSVESEQGARLGALMRCQVTPDDCETLTQLLSVASVAAVAERTKLLVAMRLTDDRAGSDRLSSLASGVPRSADLI